MGIAKLRLDTYIALFEAVSLYRKLGWAEIDRFNSDPYPDLLFEKNFNATAREQACWVDEFGDFDS